MGDDDGVERLPARGQQELMRNPVNRGDTQTENRWQTSSCTDDIIALDR